MRGYRDQGMRLDAKIRADEFTSVYMAAARIEHNRTIACSHVFPYLVAIPQDPQGRPMKRYRSRLFLFNLSGLRAYAAQCAKAANVPKHVLDVERFKYKGMDPDIVRRPSKLSETSQTSKSFTGGSCFKFPFAPKKFESAERAVRRQMKLRRRS